MSAGGYLTPCTDSSGLRYIITVANVSETSDTPTPFAPGIWALHSQPGPLFHADLEAGNLGLENLAEDGDPGPLAQSLEALGLTHGVFHTRVGSDGPGPLLPGENYTLAVDATTPSPTRLSLAFMIVQSNDWFIGTGEEGIDLQNPFGGSIADMDLTQQLYLWDSGTEVDEPAGEGANQASRQSGPNTGPEDTDSRVRLITDPQVTDLVQAAIAWDLPTVFDVTLRNISDQSRYPTPLAPGVFAADTDPDVFYMEGHARFFIEGQRKLINGLETLAEDGDPCQIHAFIGTGGFMAETMMDPFPGLARFGIFNTPVGADGPRPSLPRETYTFKVTTNQKAPHLFLALMFVQSNDLFVGSPPGGINMWVAYGNPRSGDITGYLSLWDAGTEENQMPGTGSYHPLRRSNFHLGPVDPDSTVRIVADGSAYPTVQDLVLVTVTPLEEGVPE